MFRADIECMGKDCDILIPEDFVLNSVSSPKLRDKYQEHAFSDFVKVCVTRTTLCRVCVTNVAIGVCCFRLIQNYVFVPVQTAL